MPIIVGISLTPSENVQSDYDIISKGNFFMFQQLNQSCK